MRCPACGKPVVVLEVESIEVDHCLACGGVWLDGGELELLLEGASNQRELMASLGPVVDKGEKGEAREKRLRCPICSKKLDKVRYGEKGDLVLDKCPRGDGIWFDRDELSRAIAMGRFEDGRVYELLNSIFGGAPGGPVK